LADDNEGTVFHYICRGGAGGIDERGHFPKISLRSKLGKGLLYGTQVLFNANETRDYIVHFSVAVTFPEYIGATGYKATKFSFQSFIEEGTMLGMTGEHVLQKDDVSPQVGCHHLGTEEKD